MQEDQLVQQFQTIENNFNSALASNDVNEISKYLCGDWVLLEPQYGMISKDRFLANIKSGQLIHTSMIKEVLRVRVYHEVAVVTSRGMNKGFFKNEPYNSEQWVTNVYKKESDKWVCVMTQEAPVTCI